MATIHLRLALVHMTSRNSTFLCILKSWKFNLFSRYLYVNASPEAAQGKVKRQQVLEYLFLLQARLLPHFLDQT